MCLLINVSTVIMVLFNSFLGSSLNAMFVFNLEVTHAARFALKTTAAFNEEPKKENSTWKAEENGRI